MSEPFATVQDVTNLWRTLTTVETTRAGFLLPIISDELRVRADSVGKDLDDMVAESGELANVAKSVTVDILKRILQAATDREPVSQYSESGMGYSVSGTYLNPGGELFIKNSELARLGLKKQKIGVIDLCGSKE